MNFLETLSINDINGIIYIAGGFLAGAILSFIVSFLFLSRKHNDKTNNYNPLESNANIIPQEQTIQPDVAIGQVAVADNIATQASGDNTEINPVNQENINSDTQDIAGDMSNIDLTQPAAQETVSQDMPIDDVAIQTVEPTIPVPQDSMGDTIAQTVENNQVVEGVSSLETQELTNAQQQIDTQISNLETANSIPSDANYSQTAQTAPEQIPNENTQENITPPIQ